MSDLDKILSAVQAPEPSSGLKARILQAAKEQNQTEQNQSGPEIAPQAANDNHWKRWGAMAAMAIFAATIGLTFLPSQTVDTTEADLWAETAEDIGYDELYAWVHSEETDATDSESERNESSLYKEQMPI